MKESSPEKWNSLARALEQLRLAHLRNVDAPGGHKYFGTGLDVDGCLCGRCHGLGWVRYAGVRVSCPSCSKWPAVILDEQDDEA